MPIYFADPHTNLTIKQITGADKVRMHLQNLGFVVGSDVMLISCIDNNVIVKLKGVSLAISHELAKRILV